MGKIRSLAAVMAGTALLLAGCGGDDDAADAGETDDVGTSATTGTGGSTPDSVQVTLGDGEPLEIVFISHASSADPFWGIVNNGFEDGLEAFGDEGNYRSQDTEVYDANEQAQQIRQAIAAEPDGLIVTNQQPESLIPVIQEAVDAGIPVIVSNAGGPDNAAETGALTYVGSDEELAGRMGGERLAELGVTKPILITAPQGMSPTVDRRNAGFESAFPDGAVVELAIPQADLSNATAVTKALEATLTKESDADGIFSIGALFNAPMLAARDTIGDRADGMHFGSIDLGDEVIDALRNGEMDFALDQQQWLQGYMPVMMLDLYVRYGISPATDNFVTGPSFVTAELLDRYQASIDAGLR